MKISQLTYLLALSVFGLYSFSNPQPLRESTSTICAIDSIEEVVVQVSGLVVTGDSLTPLPYATVYRARDQRGAMTDMNGFFSLPALEGDTIQFSSTGYITRHIVIEESGEKKSIKRFPSKI